MSASPQGYSHDRFAVLSHHYQNGLEAAVKSHPDEYPWAGSSLTVDDVSRKMMAGVWNGGIKSVCVHDSRGFSAACRKLGIRCTYLALGAFLRGN